MTNDPQIDANATGFPVLFTRDEFKEDVTELMLLFVQQAQFTFMADSSDQSKAIWGLLGSKASEFTGLGNAGETHRASSCVPFRESGCESGATRPSCSSPSFAKPRPPRGFRAPLPRRGGDARPPRRRAIASIGVDARPSHRRR